MQVNSGTSNTVATFVSTDSGAGIKLTDNIGSSTIQTTDAQLRIGVDEDGAVANSTIGFRVDGSTKMTLTSGGNLLIGTTTDSGNAKLQVDGNAEVSGNTALGTTVSAVYRLDVSGKARVQSVLELEDVLTLNAIATPSDPASGKSSIYMDSADGAIRVKINVGGTVVTRVLASFE